jgi:hypothetical protein
MPYEIKPPHIWTDDPNGYTYVYILNGTYVISEEDGKFMSKYQSDRHGVEKYFFPTFQEAIDWAVLQHNNGVKQWLKEV